MQIHLSDISSSEGMRIQKTVEFGMDTIEGGKTDISSSEIRAALRRGKTDISLIPPKVLAYIQEHHLYEED